MTLPVPFRSDPASVQWLLQRATFSLLLYGLLCLCAHNPVYAQTAHPAQAIIDRGAVALRTDPETSRRDAEDALATLQRNPDADLEIRARLLLCDYQSERDAAAAREQIAAANRLLAVATRPGLQAGILTCEGELAETLGENPTALALYEQAVAVATRTGDDEMLATALYSRGYLRGLQGEYAAGLTDLKQAKALYEQLQLSSHALTTLNSIAILFNRMGDYAQAQRMYTQALQEQHAGGLRREEAVTLHNLGRVHENLKEWDAARQSFQNSLQINRQLNYARGEAYALRGLAAVANGGGDPQLALQTLDRATDLQRRTPDARLHAQIQLERGTALRQLDRLPESLAALEEALAIFQQANSVTELRVIYAELAVANAQSGNWQNGYRYLEQAGQTAERLFRNQVDQRFASLKVEFDTAAQAQENILLMRENAANEKALLQARKARTLQTIVIVLTAILAVLLSVLAWHQRRTALRLRLLAMTDELTGVANRRAVLSQLVPLLRGPQASACCIMVIDIDNFKCINDRHGHAEGDRALKLVTETLRTCVAHPGFLGRLGGEEFVVVLPECDFAAACAVAEQVRVAVMSMQTGSRLDHRQITVSIGVTNSEPGTDTSSSILQRADAALYVAKRSGRNQVQANPLPRPQHDDANEPRHAPAAAAEDEIAADELPAA